MFLVTASIETNGINPTASFSTAGFSLKAYRHASYDGSIMDWARGMSSAGHQQWRITVLMRYWYANEVWESLDIKLYEVLKLTDMMTQQVQCISSPSATGMVVTSAFLIVNMSGLLHQSVIMHFWMLDTILKLGGSTSLQFVITKISKNQRLIILEYTMHTLEDVLRC